MRLLTPWGLLAAAAALPLVLWYLLRPRRHRVVVGSTFLWRAVERPATAATPWQRFRGDATFWLVLLALLALAVALARPAVPVPVALGDHTILVLDASGSMLADEDGVTRAELARREATELTSTLAPGQEVSVVEGGPRARIVLSGSTDAREVARALGTIAPRHAPSDLADAFTLATSLQRPGQRTVVHLLTDAMVSADAMALAPPGLTVSAVGTDRPNVAITRITSAPLGSGEHQVLVQVRSFAQTAVTGRLALDVDGRTVLQQALRLAPRATEDVVVTVPAVAGDTGAPLGARLELDADVTGQVPDALPFDDTASTVLAENRDLRVLLAGPGNTFLQAALRAVPGLTVESAPVVPDTLTGVDLLVVDRVDAPASLPVPTLLVAPTRWPDDVSAIGDAELPALTYQSTDHPLLADVDLTGLAVATTRVLEAPQLTVLASAPDAGLLYAGRVGDAPAVALPFDLLASDLPLRPAWPLLVANTTRWLTGGAAGTAAVPAGSVVALPSPAGTTGIVATAPDGHEVRVDPGAPTLQVDLVGPWQLAYAGTEGPVAAPTTLSVTAALEEGDLARARPEPGTPAAGGEPTLGEGLQALAWPLVLAALVLLLVEWGWSHGGRQWLHARRGARLARVRRALDDEDVASHGQVPS
ncbi:vWA domain-containing protein [Egicoccus halophilus]|uniref:vWA domain-containing protein n=1 Tax=Egicoccus halophilus TaxID=1670830 RepID=UPI0013EEBF14|nr:VWA domain-containing protein [Egicoccus halophilus]